MLLLLLFSDITTTLQLHVLSSLKFSRYFVRFPTSQRSITRLDTISTTFVPNRVNDNGLSQQSFHNAPPSQHTSDISTNKSTLLVPPATFSSLWATTTARVRPNFGHLCNTSIPRDRGLHSSGQTLASGAKSGERGDLQRASSVKDRTRRPATNSRCPRRAAPSPHLPIWPPLFQQANHPYPLNRICQPLIWRKMIPSCPRQRPQITIDSPISITSYSHSVQQLLQTKPNVHWRLISPRQSVEYRRLQSLGPLLYSNARI